LLGVVNAAKKSGQHSSAAETVARKERRRKGASVGYLEFPVGDVHFPG
jgi:hypothetical protein